jgi:hypothetical protein
VVHNISKKKKVVHKSIPINVVGKSRTGMQTGTRHPHVPPRPKFRPVSACFGRFGLFRPVYVIRPEYFKFRKMVTHSQQKPQNIQTINAVKCLPNHNNLKTHEGMTVLIFSSANRKPQYTNFFSSISQQIQNR